MIVLPRQETFLQYIDPRTLALENRRETLVSRRRWSSGGMGAGLVAMLIMSTGQDVMITARITCCSGLEMSPCATKGPP